MTTQSSFYQTLTLPSETRERERFSVQLKHHKGTDEPAFFTSPRKALQSQLNVIYFQSLKDMSSVGDRARLNTISSAYAGAWLRAVPKQNLGLCMLQHEFIYCHQDLAFLCFRILLTHSDWSIMLV